MVIRTAGEKMRMQRVRILVAIDERGEWTSFGASRTDDEEMREWICVDENVLTACMVYHWIEADVPIPDAITVEGKVVAQQ